MDIQLYKIEITKGKEKIAQEWLFFLDENKKEGLKTLEKEKVFFESYFTEEENDRLYLYIFMMSNDYKFAQKTAAKSTNEIDKKYFEYFSACSDVKNVKVMNSKLFIDNLKDKQ